MSSKINVLDIVTGHYKTLRAGGADRASIGDLVTFYLLPLGLAVIAAFLGVDLNGELSTLLVNFGAIFTALLLSVLVLVYDQEGKLKDSRGLQVKVSALKAVLQQLYFNIGYAILLSLLLVILAFGHVSLDTSNHQSFGITLCGHPFTVEVTTWVVTPLIIFVATNLVLTILMVLKRLHVLLTSRE